MVVFVTMFVANAILTELRDRGIITTPVLVLAMVFLLGGFAVYWRFCWVPRASSSEPDRPRITVAETWHSPYPPREAAARMRDAFTAPAARVTADDTSVHVRTDSDTTYRIRGAGSAKGWDAPPLAVDFAAEPPPTKAGGPCPWQPPSRQRPGTEAPGSVARSGTTSGGTPAHPSNSSRTRCAPAGPRCCAAPARRQAEPSHPRRASGVVGGRPQRNCESCWPTTRLTPSPRIETP